MSEKFKLEQLKDSKRYREYAFVLTTALDSAKTYTLAEVDKVMAKYINKRI